jgi:hypothetical protein
MEGLIGKGLSLVGPSTAVQRAFYILACLLNHLAWKAVASSVAGIIRPVREIRYEAGPLSVDIPVPGAHRACGV